MRFSPIGSQVFPYEQFVTRRRAMQSHTRTLLEKDRFLFFQLSFELYKAASRQFNWGLMLRNTIYFTVRTVIQTTSNSKQQNSLKKLRKSLSVCQEIPFPYNYHNSAHYLSSCLLFRTKLNPIGLSVPHRKHITSPLRVQQVNAIYRFVTMVY
jgi:hypothetical protein